MIRRSTITTSRADPARAATTRYPSTHERFNVELAELRHELDNHRPAVLHLAAHADFGAIHLCLGERASAVLHADLLRVIRELTGAPRLVVLSCYDSDNLAHDLAVVYSGPGRVATTVGWRGGLIDSQAHAFAQRFYPMLAAGHPVIRSFEALHLVITAHWPGRARPELFGDASAVPLR